jgi:putative heme-binding domain-containing protein
LGPDLTDVAKRYTGAKLIRQLVEPSTEINKKYQTYQFILKSGKLVSGVIVKETRGEYHVITNLLTPQVITKIRKRAVDERIASKTSSMPVGMLNVLTKQEISELASFLEAGGIKLPGHLKHKHSTK